MTQYHDPADVMVGDKEDILAGMQPEGDQPRFDDEQAESFNGEKSMALIEEGFSAVATYSPITGYRTHEQYITVPSGTTISNWVLFLAPVQMGDRESGSEKDNALLWFKVYAHAISPYTWQVYARYKYRYWRDRDGVYLPSSSYPGGEKGVVQFLLIHK